MVVNAVTIHSSLNPIEGGYPIGSALIFTCDSTNVLEKAKLAFSNMSHESYLKWKLTNAQPREWEPVGAVCFKGN